MFQNNRIGKATVNKQKGMKCKLDMGLGVNIMPLSTNKYLNPSKFDEQSLMVMVKIEPN